MTDVHREEYLTEEEEGSGEVTLHPIANRQNWPVYADHYHAPANSATILNSNLLLMQKLSLTQNNPVPTDDLLPSLYRDLQLSLTLVPNVDSLLRKPTAVAHNIPDLQKLFAALTQVDRKGLTDKQKIAIDDSKLGIMRIAQYDLDNTYHKEETSKKKAWLKKGMVFVLILLGLGFSAAESFTGATDLFSGLLKLAEPISFAIAISFAALSTLLFVALEAKGFMIETGISSPFSITKTVKSAKQQLDVARTLNKALRVPNKSLLQFEHLERYKAHVGLNQLIQQDVKQKHAMLSRSSTGGRRVLGVLKRFFSLSGASLFACAGVVVGKDLVANIALLSFGAALSGPAGIAVIITLAVAGFAIFYALQHRGVFDLFDSLAGRPKELLLEQQDFITDIDNTNNNIATNIANVELQHEVDTRKAADMRNEDSPSVSTDGEINSHATTITPDARAESPSLYAPTSPALFRENSPVSEVKKQNGVDHHTRIVHHHHP